jgi:hypothetical protein
MTDPYYRLPGEFCWGSHTHAANVEGGRALCPYCGARRKPVRRKLWDVPTLPAYYVPKRVQGGGGGDVTVRGKMQQYQWA